MIYLQAIYISICFMLIVLGLIIAIHINFWLGMSINGTIYSEIYAPITEQSRVIIINVDK